MNAQEKHQFLRTFRWYRNITMGIVEQIPLEMFEKKLCHRSLSLYCQLVDLGDMQLKVLGMVLGKKLQQDSSSLLGSPPSKEKLKAYLEQCQTIFEKAILEADFEETSLDWFGRFSFDGQGALYFIMAHECLHHGEILSFVYGLDIEMPKAFSDTWGMC